MTPAPKVELENRVFEMNALTKHEKICHEVMRVETSGSSVAGGGQTIVDEVVRQLSNVFESSPKPYDEVAEEILKPIVRPPGYDRHPREYRVVTVAGMKWMIERVQVNAAAGQGAKPRFEFTRHQRLTPFYPWLHFRNWLFNNQDERYPQKRKVFSGVTLVEIAEGAKAGSKTAASVRGNPSWSPLMQVLGWSLFTLRRLNLYELGKHWFPDVTGKNRTPACWLDFYLMATWAALGCLIGYSSQFEIRSGTIRVLLSLFCGWWIVQILQTSVYHELWRTIIDTPVTSMKKVHSRLRNAIIGFINVVAVTLLFGLIYFFSQAIKIDVGGFSTCAVPLSLLQSLYFSYTVAWSVGPVGLSPTLDSVGQVLIMLQAASTLLLVGVLLSLVVGGINPLPDDTTPKHNP